MSKLTLWRIVMLSWCAASLWIAQQAFVDHISYFWCLPALAVVIGLAVVGDRLLARQRPEPQPVTPFARVESAISPETARFLEQVRRLNARASMPFQQPPSWKQ